MKIFLIVFVVFLFRVNSQEKKLDSLTNDLIKLEEVSVSGSRATNKMPITFSKVSSKELAKRNLGQDLPILLNFLPSVVTTSDAGTGIGYTGIRVRGSDATRVNVTINGIPYNDSESQGTFWVNLPDMASSIKNIQLQRGVGTSTNGSSAFGASINILTDGPSKKGYTEFSQSLGTFGTSKRTVKYSTGIIKNHFEFSARHSKILSDGYVERASSNLKSHFFQGLYFDETTLLKAIIFGGSEITYQSWYGVDENKILENRRYNFAGEMFDDDKLIGFYENQVDDYNQNHFQFHWNETLNFNWNFSLGLNYTKGRGFYEEYNNDQSLESLQLNNIQIGNTNIIKTDNVTQKWLDNNYYVGTFSFQQTTNNKELIIGGSYGKYFGNHFGNLIWAKFSSNALPNHRFYKNKGEKIDATLYSKINYILNKKLSFFADLQIRKVKYNVTGTINGPNRIDIDDNFIFFNPKAGFNFLINNYNSVYFSYAKANREPNRNDYENGSPKPERLSDFEAGLRIKKRNFKFNANLYYMKYRDQLVLTGELDEVGSLKRQNVGDSYRLGIEIDSSVKLKNNLIWSNNISLSRNINKEFYFKRDGKIENLGETNISFSPSVIAANSIELFPNESFKIEFLSKFIGEQYMGNIDSAFSKLDSYLVNDIILNYYYNPDNWINKIQLSFLINNVFDNEYSSNGYFYTYDNSWSDPNGNIKTIEGVRYYPQAGINLLFGCSINF
ncbi:MAG: TonB-dependent receptor [Flavobacteriaceae bacterium]|nr:TonB-dependent receptor [Flavobacteriaceae bacterium]